MTCILLETKIYFYIDTSFKLITFLVTVCDIRTNVSIFKGFFNNIEAVQVCNNSDFQLLILQSA